MKKVRNIFLADPKELGDSYAATGLVLEMEDGSMYKHSSTDPIQPFALMKEAPKKKQIKAHDFPKVYETLGIDLSKLGCIMLDLEPLDLSWIVQEPFAGSQVNLDRELEPYLYTAKDPSRFWIQGLVGKEPHATLLYGLLTPGNESPMKELVPQVLEGWECPEVTIDHVGYFESPYADEPYWCIVAHLAITPELQEGNDRLKMLPHINTFPGYKAHVTVAYIKADSEKYRDWVIDELNRGLKGKKLKVTGLNFGGNK